MPNLLAALGLVFAVSTLAACASTPSPVLGAASQAHPHSAEIWADKCGSCHVPVEPGTRARSVIEAAMPRHQTRVELTADEWRDLIEFLAFDPSRAPAPPPAAAAPPAP